jgi:hypothetical protein
MGSVHNPLGDPQRVAQYLQQNGHLQCIAAESNPAQPIT